MRLRYTGDVPGLPEGVDTNNIEHSETCVAHRVPVEMTGDQDPALTAVLQRICVHPGDVVTMSDELGARHLATSIWVGVVEEAPARRGKAAAAAEVSAPDPVEETKN